MSQPVRTVIAFVSFPIAVSGFHSSKACKVVVSSLLAAIGFISLSLHAQSIPVSGTSSLDFMSTAFMSTAFWQSSTPLLALLFVCVLMLLLVLGLLLTDVMHSHSQVRAIKAELQRNAEEQALLLWSAQLGSWRWNLRTDQITVDAGAARLLDMPEWGGVVDMQNPGPGQQLFTTMMDDFEESEVMTERHIRTAAAYRWLKLRGRLLQSEGDPVVLGTIADVSDQHEYQERLIKKSIDDPLTQVLNRHYFIERLTQYCSQAARDDNLLTVALIGIDDFKVINEQQGHRVGDEVLRRFSGLLQQLCRPYDLVARYGDSQFVTLFYGLDKVQSMSVVKRLQESLKVTRLVVDSHRLSCTCSCGIADSREFEQGKLTVSDILSLCHKRLSIAKQKGHNQIVIDTEAA